ncbi:MAG: hypothetical protein KDA68_21075, partial [Planctomycetaceae bacterium]|nr:hypothetical protein [Planctomycetaceae bacterium]
YDSQLRELILSQQSELPELLKSGKILEAAGILLRWTAVTGDFALDGVPLATDFTTIGELYFRILKEDQAGMSCGGYGNYFSGVLALFGIPSLNIGFGESPDLTHVTVVVPVQDKNGRQFHLMDPTFGSTFRIDHLSRPATFFEIVDLLRSNELERVTIESIPLDERDFLSTSPYEADQLIFKRKLSKFYVFSWLNYGFETYLETYAEEFQKRKYASGLQGYVELMSKHMINAIGYGDGAAQIRDEFLKELKAHDIPFGA